MKLEKANNEATFALIRVLLENPRPGKASWPKGDSLERYILGAMGFDLVMQHRTAIVQYLGKHLAY
jgi:hypothetical protein